MTDPGGDGRSSEARGYAKAMQATSIALQMVVPAMAGYWLDGWWGTQPWLLIGGVLLGFLVAMMQMLALAKQSSQPTTSRPSPANRSTGKP